MNSSTKNMFDTQSTSSSSISYASVCAKNIISWPYPEGVYVEEPCHRPSSNLPVRRRVISRVVVKPITAMGRRVNAAKAFVKKMGSRASCVTRADRDCYDRCRRLLRQRTLVQQRFNEERERRYWAKVRAQEKEEVRRPAQPTSVKQVKTRNVRPDDWSNIDPIYWDDLMAPREQPAEQKRSLTAALLKTRPGAALLVAIWIKKNNVHHERYLDFSSPEQWRSFMKSCRSVKCVRPEMEDASAQGEGDLSHVSTGNVVLTEARAESVASGPVECDFNWSGVSSNDVITSIANLTDRFIPVRNFTWPRDAEHGNQNDYICDLVLPKDMVLSYSQSMCDLPSALPFLCHMYSRFDMEIKVHVNCNKFQVGQLQGTFWYEPEMDRLFSERNNIWCASQNHHILISAGTSNEATLKVPFVFRKSFLLNKSMPTMEKPLELGTFRLAIMNPLRSSSSVSNKAYGTIFVKFTNASFTGMKSGALGTQRRIHYVEPQSGGDERVSAKTSAVAPGYSLATTSHGRYMFGENFGDLKDYCRRFQYYATYNGSKDFKISGSGKVCAVVPILPQGLDLGIDSSGRGGTEFVNFHRDGHIPIISSGFRYFRGGLRFKIIGPKIVKANILVQHIPPLEYRGDRLVSCTSISKSIDMLFHSYASYVQNLGLNNIVEIEVPYYNGACYTLLQNPSSVDTEITDAQSYYDLGQLLISVDLVGTDPLSIPKNWSVVIYYSFADDARCMLFQGFPPVTLLDAIRYSGASDEDIVKEVLPEMDEILRVGAMKLLDTMLPDANRDNPPDTSPAMPVVLNSSHSWALGTGSSEPINTLRLDPRAQTRYPGGVGSDEMQVSQLVNVWGFVKTLTWSMDQNAGDKIYRCDASPIIDITQYKSWSYDVKTQLSLVALPPCAVVSSLFHYWRGDLEFRFDFICSQYHTGRVMLCYIPGQDTDVTMAQARSSPNIVFTLNESDQCIFKVPYIADRPWWPRQYSYGDTDTQRKAPSQLFLFVVNPLVVMDSVPNSIEINMYMRGGSSFEVAIPAQPSIGLNRNTHYRVLPDSYYITSTSDSYYVGYEHSFVIGNKYYGIFRYATTSEALAQFDLPQEKYRSGTIWALDSSEAGPKADLDGSMTEASAMVLVRIEKKYIYGLVIPPGEHASNILKYLNTEAVKKLGLDWDWKGVADDLWLVNSSTSNEWSVSGLHWYPRTKLRVVRPEMGLGDTVREKCQSIIKKFDDPEPSTSKGVKEEKPGVVEKMVTRVGTTVVENASKNIINEIKESVNESVEAIKEAVGENQSDSMSSFVMIALTHLLQVIFNFNVYSISIAILSLLVAFGKWLYSSYDKILSLVQRIVSKLTSNAEEEKQKVTHVQGQSGDSQYTYSVQRKEIIRQREIRHLFAIAASMEIKAHHEMAYFDPPVDFEKMYHKYVHKIPVSPVDPLYSAFHFAYVMYALRFFGSDLVRRDFLVEHNFFITDLSEVQFSKKFPFIYEWCIQLVTSNELQQDVAEVKDHRYKVFADAGWDIQRIIHTVEPEGDDGDDLSALEKDISNFVGILFSCVSQGISYTNRPEHIKKKWKEMLFNDIALGARGANNVMYFVRNIFKTLKNMVCHIIDWIHPNYRAAKALSAVVPSLSVFVSECHTLLHPDNKAKALVDARIQSRVIDAAMYATIIRSYASESKVEGYNAIAATCKDIIEFRNLLARKGRSPLVRPSPFTVCMSGETGVGKSFISGKLMVEMLDSMQISYNTSPYYTIPTSEFWDGLLGNEPCVYADDMFKSRDATQLMNDVNRIYEIKNTAPLQPNMASLEDKGMQYVPTIFWYNTNIPFPDEACITYPSAVYSRRDLLVYVKKTEKYATKSLQSCSLEELSKWDHVEFYYTTEVMNKKIFQSIKNDGPPESGVIGPLKYHAFTSQLKKFFGEYYVREQKKYNDHINSIYSLMDSSVERINKELYDPCAVISEEDLLVKFVKAKAGSEIALKDSGLLPSIPYFQRGDKLLKNSKVVKAFEIFFNLPSLIYDRKLLDTLRTRFKLKYLTLMKTPEIDDQVVRECYLASTTKIEHEREVPEEFLLPTEQEIASFVSGEANDEQVVADYSKLALGVKGMGRVRLFLKQIIPDEKHINKLLLPGPVEQSSDIPAAIYHFVQQLHIDSKSYWYHGSDYNLLCYFLMKNFQNKKLSFKDTECCVHYASMSKKFELVNGKVCNSGNEISFDTCESNPLCLAHLPLYHHLIHYWLIKECYAYSCACKLKKADQVVPFFKSEIENASISRFEKFYYNIGEFVNKTYIKYLSGPLKKIWNILTSKWFCIGMATLTTIIGVVCRDRIGIACGLSNAARCVAQGPYAISEVAPKIVPYAHPVLPHASNHEVNDTIRCLKSNMVSFEILFENSTLHRKYNCLMLKNRLCLVILHYFEDIDAIFKRDSSARLYFVYDGEKRVPLIFEDLKATWFKKSVGKSNFGVVELPVRVRQFSKITHFIASKNSLCKAGVEGVFVRPHDTINVNVRKSHSYQIVPSETSSEVYIETAFEYGLSQKGLCGSLLLSSNLSKGIVIGMHVAGDGAIGIAEPLCIEMFEEMKQETTRVKYVAVPKLSDVSLAKLMPDTSIYPLGVVEPKLAHQESGKSRIVPSKIQGVFPVLTEPNPLHSNDVRLPPGNSPMLRGVEKHGLVPLGFPDSILKKAYISLRNKILANCKPVRIEISPLTVEQACCGDLEIPHCEPLNWSSSEGFYLAAHRPPGVSGKKWMFDLDETSGGYQLLGLHPVLSQQMSIKQKLRENGIMPFTCFVDCLKDTRLPKEKCSVPGKTRIFSISPVDFTIQFKQYYQDFLSSYQFNRLGCEHAIGIDCNSVEWTSYYKLLQSKGVKVISGDYSNFGPGMVMECVYYAFQIIIDWYVYNGASEEHIHMLHMLRDEVINANHLCFNLVYSVASSIPSGSPITTPLNSLVNCLYIRCAWHLLGLDLGIFDKHVSMVTYGDDIVINVSDEVCDIFNLETISNVLLERGIVFTHCSKVRTDVKYEHISDITFLKRRWVPHPIRSGLYLAPLEEMSITDCANWILDKGDKLEASLLNSQQAVLLAYSHGPSFYEEVAEKIRKAWCKLYVNFEYEEWSTLDAKFFGN